MASHWPEGWATDLPGARCQKHSQSLQVDIELPLALCALLFNGTQDKDLVCASLSFPKACVLSSQVSVDCLGYWLDDDLGQDLAGYR